MKSTITDVDVVVRQQLLNEVNEMGLLTMRKDVGNLYFLYKFIKLLLLLLPFLQSQEVVNPLSCVATQNINRFFALWLLFFNIENWLISLHHFLF